VVRGRAGAVAAMVVVAPRSRRSAHCPTVRRALWGMRRAPAARGQTL